MGIQNTLNTDYYSKISEYRDSNLLPKNSSADTSVGYQYTGMTEEMRIGIQVTREHYEKVYQENLKHSDPLAYITEKYYDKSSRYFCGYMTEEQRIFAARTEKTMIETGGKTMCGYASYDYSLRNYEGIYTGGKNTGFHLNTDREKQYARSVVNQQIYSLLGKNGIQVTNQMSLKFQIDPYSYKLTVTGNTSTDVLSAMEQILNEGDNAKNLWDHLWICMHDRDNEIVNFQGSRRKAEQYSLWHEFYQTTGYDIRESKYQNGTFVAADGTDLLELYKKNAKHIEGIDLYIKRFLSFAQNGWNKADDLTIAAGFDSNGLYDIGQENGFGINQTAWIKGGIQNILDVKI